MSRDTVTIVGAGLIAPGALRRLLSEEYDRLLQTVGRDTKLLSDEEIASLREQARRVVLKRLRADDKTLVGTGSLSDNGAVRAVEHADALAAELAPVRRQFATKDADVGTAGALLHRRAEIVLAAMNEKPTEESYGRVLAALDSEAARKAEPNELDDHLENARVLSDAAEAELHQRGLRKADVDYEQAYVAEVTRLSRAYNLPHGRGSQ
jgi:hypothetical protein